MTSSELRIKANNRKLSGFEEDNEGLWQGPFLFIQASDTQFGMIDEYLLKKEVIKWDEEIELTKKAIAAINTMLPRPRFLVVCGDLIHAMPGAELRSAQEKDFMKVFRELREDIPLICVCGNHDVGNKPTPTSIESYREKFGDDYFSFYCGGVMFIVINSQYYEDSSLVEDLAEKQNEWLDERLESANSSGCKHIIIFQHIPWFVKDPEEDKIYFNIEINLRKKMLEKLYDANVRTVFCGHYHRNAGGFFKEMEVVVTSAIGAQLGDDKSGFRIVKVLQDSVLHEYYELDKVPEEVQF